MNVSPSVCQIVMTATAEQRPGRGSAGSAGCGLMPEPRQQTRPTGFNSVPKITAATATDVATVDEKNVR